MSGHANFILLNGTWLGANDSSKALGFVVLSPVATLSWEIHTTAGLRQGQKKKKKPPIGSARTACLCFVAIARDKNRKCKLAAISVQFVTAISQVSNMLET